MFGWLGNIINGATNLGGQWLRNRGRVAQATADYKLAQLEAKTGLALTEAEIELETRRKTFDLDRLAVEQGGKTIWDEVLCIAALAPLGLIVYGVCVSVPPELWGWNILMAFSNIPIAYLILVALIYVRYLGYRNLLRVGLKIWGKKIFNFDMEMSEGSKQAPAKDGVRDPTPDSKVVTPSQNQP